MCWSRYEDRNAVNGLIPLIRGQSRPNTFFFGDMVDVGDCAEACAKEPNCVVRASEYRTIDITKMNDNQMKQRM